MGLQLYDLAGAEPERRFSPYCWRTKLALMHKGLQFDTIPWRFTDKDAIAFSGQGRVPVLSTAIKSFSIPGQLRPISRTPMQIVLRCFVATARRAVTRFVNAWADGVLVGGILRLIVTDILAHLDEKDRAYFRETREDRFGAALEDGHLRSRDECAGLPQDLGAHSHRTRSTALLRWRDAGLRRLCRVRLFPMGAMHQLISAAAQG